MLSLSATEKSLFSRRVFMNRTSQWGVLAAAYQLLPLPLLAKSLAGDSRIAQTAVVDMGFASVRKIGEGLYATISDTSKGLQTMCNGGFLAGKEGGLLVEGFVSPAGAGFQHETYRSVSKAPVIGALDTHYHFDHSLGNAYYGANGIALWAHANTAKRIIDSYGALQGVDKSAVVGPLGSPCTKRKNGSCAQTRYGICGDHRQHFWHGQFHGAGAAEPSVRPGKVADEGGPRRADGGS